jgi:hypothetical protein
MAEEGDASAEPVSIYEGDQGLGDIHFLDEHLPRWSNKRIKGDDD